MPREILLGAIIGAHGLKGEVKVKTFTEAPERLGTYGPLYLKDGRALTVISVFGVKAGQAVLRLAEVTTREGAEALKGAELFVPRAALPATDAGEFYHADLLGLRAEDVEGRVLGAVHAVHNYGAGDVIEIQRDDGDNVLLPFTEVFVPIVDVAGGRIVVAPPEEVETGEQNPAINSGNVKGKTG